jgi:hypothetical protein
MRPATSAPICSTAEGLGARVRPDDTRDHACVNTSFITTFDRDDIAVLAGGLDDSVDEIEAGRNPTELSKIAK